MKHYSRLVWTFATVPFPRGWIGAPATYRAARVVRRPSVKMCHVAIVPGYAPPAWQLRFGRGSRAAGVRAFVARGKS